VGRGRRVYPSAIPGNDYRRRDAPELQRGMQRPFRLRKAFGATGRLGRATSQRVVATFHLSPFHFSLLTCLGSLSGSA
jgi:hypothetical protein